MLGICFLHLFCFTAPFEASGVIKVLDIGAQIANMGTCVLCVQSWQR